MQMQQKTGPGEKKASHTCSESRYSVTLLEFSPLVGRQGEYEPTVSAVPWGAPSPALQLIEGGDCPALLCAGAASP